MPDNIKTEDLSAQNFAATLQKYVYSPSSTSLKSHIKASPSTPTRSLRSKYHPSPSTPISTPQKRLRLDSSFSTTSPDEPQTPDSSKKSKKPRPFASPEVYAHLKRVGDILQPDLDIVFCGINPGKRSSTEGHHFAHPTNKFWRAIHLSGLTDRQLSPMEDHLLPDLYNYGLTNLVDRPTSEQSELSTLEMRLNVFQFSQKIILNRPKVVCFVGKKIWDVYESVVSKTAVSTSQPSTPKKQIKSEPTWSSNISCEDPIELNVKTEIREETNLGNSIRLRSPPLTPISDHSERYHTAKHEEQSTTVHWTQSRRLRLPLPPSDEGEGKEEFCYFWVVPNTSGLERTPVRSFSMIKLVERFKRLKEFVGMVKDGRAGNEWRDIDLIGVERATENKRLAGEKRGKR
ncbi:hypothetical protein TREMEDRAFT_65863 [Tremella mesenterica DSM 1558]|uniref:uncharacterized protein n=1 Tax=Tremella mesenterica (strain ATCC 24925 / CBS 8224 / DSM 1558 / NBRC 9311 / NRRL Y-6157 / RJB 2259-6 / UBC 559-6) TaxID=578456 RepID=UPI00032C8CE0|nr:uncharacterized protein TREMEDRAFT_65863 [Tremella mesenterica DSM 1558]EIW66020.1 hypothetical protein TREMEDRAFT_65863 [Tremella mesenterica DSM 1558]